MRALSFFSLLPFMNHAATANPMSTKMISILLHLSAAGPLVRLPFVCLSSAFRLSITTKIARIEKCVKGGAERGRDRAAALPFQQQIYILDSQVAYTVTMSYEIECDECKHKFTFELHERTVRGGTLRYFDCPNCPTRYNVGIVSKRGERLMQQQRALLRLGQGGSARYRKVVRELSSAVTPYQPKVERRTEDLPPGRDPPPQLPPEHRPELHPHPDPDQD